MMQMSLLTVQTVKILEFQKSGRLPLLSASPAVTPCNPEEGCYQFCCLVKEAQWV